MATKTKKGKGTPPMKAKVITKPKPKPKETEKAKAKPKTEPKLQPKPKLKPKPNLKLNQKKTKPVQVKAQIKAQVKAKVKPTPKLKIKEIPKEKTLGGPYEEIKKILQRQKHAILIEAGAIINNAFNPEGEAFPDWTDQASVETDQNFVLRLREREQHLLKKIEDAIERIGEDNFGVCEGCGGIISIQRLKARPVTTFCIECKTKQETEERIRQ